MSKKYKPRNQFRYSKSKIAGYHPHYIFGEVGNNYLSFGMTTHPSKHMVVSEIKSPNPNYKGRQYIQHKPFKMRKSAFKNRRERGWAFDKADLPLIRNMKKKYRKSK